MATVYLSTAGSDSYTYAQAQNSATPWLTPSKVNTSATTGDTVQFLVAGTYTFPNVTFTKSFTWIGATTTASDTIIDSGASNSTWGFNGTTQTISYVKFTGTATGATRFSNSFGASGTQFAFTNCIFKDFAYRNVAGQGMFQNYQNTATTNAQFVFTNCVWDNPVTTAGTTTGLFWLSGLYAKVTMNKCTIYVKDPTTGMEVLFKTEGTVATPTIKNCVFHNASGKTVNLVSIYSGGGVTPTYSYSDIYQFTGSPTGTGVITTDPLMVDPASSNFNLRPTSPALDTGTTS